MNSTHSVLPADTQKLGDLIAVRHFPTVIQAADIRALRQNSRANDNADSEAVSAFTGGYLGVDDASSQALQRALRALCGDATHAPGGAFFLNGVFGAGKSHFLGVLGLLAQRRGLRAFALSNPQCAPLVGRLHNRRQLALHIALDEYDGERWSLEAIFWRELALEWKRAGCDDDAPIAEENLSRREQFSSLEEALIAHEFDGLLVCWDELSLFLAAREHRALQADAAWLQFLGQRARPPQNDAASTCRPSLCVFAALQKTVEDIGGIETYSLQQIRDRFQTLPLATAHIPALIERRLIEIRDEEAVARVCRASFETLSNALPRLEFGRDEWRQLMPFHPPIIALLEQCVARFLSRTRSAAIFCAAAINLNAPAESRVGIGELFDYLRGELDEHPELRALGEVWRGWENELANIAQNAVDEGAMRRVMQAMVVFKIAGIAPDATQIAHAIALDAHLPDEGNYAWAQVLAERLRTRGGHIAVERHEGEWADRWTIDAGVRAGEAARRALQNTLESFAPDDARVWRHALDCCRQTALPLRELEEARSYDIFWHNTPRRVQALLWRAGHEGDDIAARDWTLNRIALLSQPAAVQPGARDELLILLAHGEVSRDFFHQLREHLPNEPRNNARVALWLARRPTDDEWRAMSEACGAHLLADDPQLLDNRRGRAVLGILQNEGAAYDARTAQIMERLWREGELISGDGGALEASELTAAQSWTSTLEAVADWLLPNVFPLFESVAPRARVLTPGNADQLGLEILRRPAQAPFFAPSLERLVRHLAAPLGVANERDGRWMIALPDENLRHDLEAALQQNGALTLSALYDQFARNEWGLVAEQMQLAICALLRGGQWLAVDARGAALSALEIGLPLRRSVHTLREGALLDENAWRRVQSLLQIVAPEQADNQSAPDFQSQQQAYIAVREWATNARGECELMRARWHQLRRQIGGQNTEISRDATPNARWSNLQSALETVESVLHAADSDGGAVQVLAGVAPRVNAQFFTSLHKWQQWRERFDAQHALLVEMHGFLTHDALATPPDLQGARQELLQRLAQGEDSLCDETLGADFNAWRRNYAAQYAQWHCAQHDPARWTSLERLASRDDWRAVERLSSLQNVDFSIGEEENARAQLDDELEKRCARDGSLDGFPVCASCRLRWNQRLILRTPDELSAALEQTRARLQTLLQDAPTRERLARATPDDSEIWLEWDGELSNLATLSPVALQTLDEALKPRRRVVRAVSELNALLRACRTRDECAATFAVWLDGGQALRGDDEIEWSD